MCSNYETCLMVYSALQDLTTKFFQGNYCCGTEFADINDICFKLMFFNSVYKAGSNGILYHTLVLSVHTV